MQVHLDASCLNILFSKRSMEQLAESGTCGAFQSAVSLFVRRSDGMTKGEALSQLFSYMGKNSRNEYLYKSLLLKKIVYGRHSPRTTSAICELPVGKSIADFVLINGKACIYEIKTDLDNFSRLDSQLNDYYRAFRYVSVVSSEKSASTLSELLKDSPVGLMVLSDRLTFRTLKEPLCWTSAIDASAQFDLLRKKEREEVLLQCGADLPDTTPVRYYSACLERFQALDDASRISVFESILKRRGQRVDQAALAIYPDEFKLIAYNHGANVRQGEKLLEFAQSKLE